MTSADGRAENQWRIEDSTFLRLIPGPSEERGYRGGRIRLISLEVYEEGTIVIWHLHSLSRSLYDEAAEHPDVIAAVERYAQSDMERGLTSEQRALNLKFHRQFFIRQAIWPNGVSMTDDRGQTYTTRSSQTSGTVNFRGTANLMPAIAPDAQHLTIVIGGVTFRIDLT
jgi:hypothetical protein